jgi:hypothetical protein
MRPVVCAGVKVEAGDRIREALAKAGLAYAGRPEQA